MILYKKYPLAADGKEYEIRVLYEGNLINVAAFYNNHPASGFRYQVVIPRTCDAKALLDKGADRHLVETCKQDVIGNRWEEVKNKVLCYLKPLFPFSLKQLIFTFYTNIQNIFDIAKSKTKDLQSYLELFLSTTLLMTSSKCRKVLCNPNGSSSYSFHASP